MGADDFFKKRKAGRKKREKDVHSMRNSTWLFVCEGTKTEPNYIRNLICRINSAADPSHKIKADIKGQGKNTTSLVSSADTYFEFVDEEYGKMDIPYGNIALIFDKDSFGKNQFNSAVEMADRLNAQTPYGKVYTGWSNESFELWLNLHFSYIDSNIGRDTLNDKLTEKLRNSGVLSKRQSYSKYGKSLPDLYDDILKSGGSIRAAIRNAKKLADKYNGKSYSDHSPCTMMHIVVEALLDDSGLSLDDLEKLQ